jgi:hypothetical protein
MVIFLSFRRTVYRQTINDGGDGRNAFEALDPLQPKKLSARRATCKGLRMGSSIGLEPFGPSSLRR